MKHIDEPQPGWVPCLFKFIGCGNASWLIHLPINKPGAPVETVLELNHPWTHQVVQLEFAGILQVRKPIYKYTQKVMPEAPKSRELFMRSPL